MSCMTSEIFVQVDHAPVNAVTYLGAHVFQVGSSAKPQPS
jgi:hypothetical protein